MAPAFLLSCPIPLSRHPLGIPTITLDMSECVHPIPQGTYALKVTTYACGDILNPRNGYVLANDTANNYSQRADYLCH
ncbi:MAG: hypothetical protein ACOX47_06090 [Bacillota bacterium]